MISNPLTQQITAPENKSGRTAKYPVTAKNAPIGASDKPTHSTRWHNAVKRLV